MGENNDNRKYNKLKIMKKNNFQYSLILQMQ